MADKKVTVAVEVDPTIKLGGPTAGPGPAGSVSAAAGPAFVAQQFRLLGLQVQKLGGFGVGPTSIVTSSGSQVVSAGVVAGFQKSKGILASAWSAAMYGAGGIGGGRFGPPVPGQSFAGNPSGMKKAYDELTKSIHQMRFGLLAASAAAMGFVAGGAPMAWRTFTGSVTLLGDQFAQLLIPAFMSASYQLQQAATWIENLDSRTKGLIATTATWGGSILVVSAILTGIGSVLVPVVRGVLMLGTAFRASLAYNNWTTVLTGISAGFTGLGTAIKGAAASALTFAVSPLGIALVATVGVVGYLTNGFGLLGHAIDNAGARADSTRERMERLTRLQQPGAQLTRADFESLGTAMVQRIETTPMQQRQELFRNLLRERQAQLQRTQFYDTTRNSAILEDLLTRENAQAANAPFGMGQLALRQRANRIRTQMIGALTGAGVDIVQARRQVEAIADEEFRPGRTPEQIRATAQLGGQRTLEAAQRDTVVLMERLLTQGVPGVFNALKASTPLQGQMFQSGIDAYYQVLQDVLTRGPVEQDHLRNIMNANQEAVRILGEINGRLLGGAPAAPANQPVAMPP